MRCSNCATTMGNSGTYLCFEHYSSTSKYIVWDYLSNNPNPIPSKSDGFNAIIGAFPGKESDEEVLRALDEVE